MVTGHASFSVLFWDVDIDFEVEWGDAPAPALPSVGSARSGRRARGTGELAGPAPGRRRGARHACASLDHRTTCSRIRSGELSVLQRVVPLGIDIDRVGRLVPVRRQQLRHLRRRDRRGARSSRRAFREEHFARGEYLDLPKRRSCRRRPSNGSAPESSSSTDDFTSPADQVGFDPEFETLYLGEPEAGERGVVPRVDPAAPGAASARLPLAAASRREARGRRHARHQGRARRAVHASPTPALGRTAAQRRRARYTEASQLRPRRGRRDRRSKPPSWWRGHELPIPALGSARPRVRDHRPRPRWARRSQRGRASRSGVTLTRAAPPRRPPALRARATSSASTRDRSCAPSRARGTTNFAPNQFAAIEFDPPDFPWMFTPARPGANDRLRPWLVLVVVASNSRGRHRREPRPAASPADDRGPAVPASELPDLRESWAWAHAHMVEDDGGRRRRRTTWPRTRSQRLAARCALADSSPIATTSRCLVPAFEAGRLAGLGQPVPEPDRRPNRPGARRQRRRHGRAAALLPLGVPDRPGRRLRVAGAKARPAPGPRHRRARARCSSAMPTRRCRRFPPVAGGHRRARRSPAGARAGDRRRARPRARAVLRRRSIAPRCRRPRTSLDGRRRPTAGGASRRPSTGAGTPGSTSLAPASCRSGSATSTPTPGTAPPPVSAPRSSGPTRSATWMRPGSRSATSSPRTSRSTSRG